MNHFLCVLIYSFLLLAKVDGRGIPDDDYTTFFQNPETSDENLFVFDDSTDWFADAANTNNGDCLSYDDDDSDDLFFSSSNVARRVRTRNTCTNPAAAPPPPPYTDIYNTNDILNELSPSPSPPPPTIPNTEQDSYILDLERQLNLPSFDAAPKPTTTTNDDDDICPAEYFGDSRIPVCDLGDLKRNGQCPPDSVYFNIYGVRPCTVSFHSIFFFFFFFNKDFLVECRVGSVHENSRSTLRSQIAQPTLAYRRTRSGAARRLFLR